MREIKFRQPRIAKGKFHHWHYWGYVDDNKGHFVAPLPPNTGGDSYQYTGRKDKNGKEIYEGDCFKTSDKHGYSSGCIAEVLFEDGAFVVQLYRSDDMEIAPELILDFKRSFQDSFEIIGDIHTTPELLEKQND